MVKDMRNSIKYSLFVALLAVSFSCADYAELEKNPNRPAEVPASLILRGVLAEIYEAPWDDNTYWNQYWLVNYNYYGTNEYWTTAGLRFTTLKNIGKMEEAAAPLGEVNAYSAMGHFLKAYFYFQMTRRVGDLPLDEAVLGLENSKPKYATQKQIYIYILNELEAANSEMKTLTEANDQALAGDIYFGNDLSKWRRATNSFKLRVLVSLSKKASDPDLGVPAKFSAVVSNPSQYPVMESNGDNMNYVYNGSTQIYPTNPGNRGFDKGRYNMGETFVKGLTDLNDPRIFVVSNPAKALVKPIGTLEADDFNAYKGAPAGLSLGDMAPNAALGLYSYSNQKRYYTSLTGPEPAVQMAYWETCFNIAEGINRGWAAGNAATYYLNGIKASMAFFGITDGANLTITEQDGDQPLKTVSASVTNYLAQPAVAYKGNNADGLTQILNQKYLAYFNNCGLEAYFNFRRTGTPAFNQGPGTGNSNVIPRRWLYPNSEAFYNTDNYKAALQAQFGSPVDDVDNELWEVKN